MKLQYSNTIIYSRLALAPFGRYSEEIVMLWEINKDVTSPSLKSMRFF